MGGTALAYCIVACWWVANTLDRSLPSRQLEGFIHGCTQQTVPNPNTVYDTEQLNYSWMQVMILIVFCVKTGTAGLLLHYNVFDFVVNKVKS